MIRIGTSGYSYEHWRNLFYPKTLKQKEWLEYYSKHFDTVELNVTFYRLLRKEVFKSWYKKTPSDFLFSIKGSRFITHIKRLKDVKDSLKLFFQSFKPLSKKTSVILWQLPPIFKIDFERMLLYAIQTGMI